MKNFKVCPAELGIDTVVSPIDKEEILENKDLIVLIAEDEIYPNVDNWDYDGFLNSIPKLKDTNIFRQPQMVNDLIVEFNESDEETFYDFLHSEDKLFDLIADYISIDYPNVFCVFREGHWPPKSFMDEFDHTFYLQDPDNVVDNLSEHDFGLLQIESQ